MSKMKMKIQPLHNMSTKTPFKPKSLCKNNKKSSSGIYTVDTTWFDILSNAKDIHTFVNVKDALMVDGFKGSNTVFGAKHEV